MSCASKFEVPSNIPVRGFDAVAGELVGGERGVVGRAVGNGAEAVWRNGEREGNGGRDNIYQSIAYMVQHCDEPLQVATLASVAKVSCSHFFAVFKQVMGFTPMDFFIRLRMQRACGLLESTGLCIKQVAAAIGYDDAFYFSRLFKSVNGVAPTEYRKLEEGRRQRIRETVLPVRNGCVVVLGGERERWAPNDERTSS